MKKNLSVLLSIVIACALFTGCSSGKLSDDKAKVTVEALLAKGKELPDNCCPPATLIEWRGLVASSDTEMQGKAVIQHNDGKMSGAFLFHKSSDGGWVLDKVAFRSDSGGSWWNAEVFQKVQ